MPGRLSSLARRRPRIPGIRGLTPAALTAALVLTAGTGAGAVSLRGADRDQPAHPAPTPSSAPTRLALPAPPAPAAPVPDDAAQASTVAATPVVPKARHLVQATVLVTSRTALSRRTLHALRHAPGVRATTTVAVGTARVDHHKALLLGVHPATFRPWTPRLTARSQPLWQSIARGELTASFDMGQGARLPLGQDVPVKATRTMPLRIGAFASVGMAGVDAVVSMQRARQLGLTPRTGVVVSAPHADALTVRRALAAVVGNHGHASLLREVVVIRDAGEFLTRVQINTVLQAAASRVGKPYVWGATGPDSFDCSGLVQWSFARAGIAMPRVSQQQWYAGPHVSYSSALPGDLLFWHYDPTDRTNIDHVAIYAGNGMMLVAPHTGAFVEYVPVPLTNLAGVVRVDPAMAAQVG